VTNTLTNYDFASSEPNEASVWQLQRGGLIQNAENVVLIGWPKTDKSHVTLDIDVQAIKHHSLKVRFCLTVELATALEQEKVLGKAGKWPMWHPNRLGHP
jgi:DNA replication protein DnaC